MGSPDPVLGWDVCCWEEKLLATVHFCKCSCLYTIIMWNFGLVPNVDCTPSLVAIPKLMNRSMRHATMSRQLALRRVRFLVLGVPCLWFAMAEVESR
jgi:hypothetical protein